MLLRSNSNVPHVCKQSGKNRGDFVIYFHPALTIETAKSTWLKLYQTQNQKRIFNVSSLDYYDKKSKTLVLWEDLLEYKIYETHQLKVNLKRELIEALFISFDDMEEHTINMSAVFENDRAFFLDWFPSNINPQEYGMKIDFSKIPQKPHPWFKPSSEVSGTKTYKLLGYFVPSKKENPNYSFDDAPVFSDYQKKVMHLGTLNEDYVIMAYLHTFKETTYHETGWCALPKGYPYNWGSVPDGIITYGNEKGVCEFKTSRSKTCMEPYFFPQVYMEMMSTNLEWGDLVRYKSDGIREDDEAHIYRINRDRKLESQLLELWIYAFHNRHRIQEVILEPLFVQMRTRLNEMAKTIKPFHIIAVGQDVELLKKFQIYNEYRRKIMDKL